VFEADITLNQHNLLKVSEDFSFLMRIINQIIVFASQHSPNYRVPGMLQSLPCSGNIKTQYHLSE